MVVTRAQLVVGEWVLVWGIGGGVSLAALRIAKQLGAKVIATSSSDAKLERATELGADFTLNHQTQQIAREVRALTGKRGVDVVVENVGQATWAESLRCLAKGGRVVTCGGTSGPQLVTDVRPLFWHQFTILGSTMGNAAEYREVVRQLGLGRLRPIVDAVYPLARAREAYERLEHGAQIGKVTVSLTE
jgi:NADPH:quinone reductase-like Zn-dependent oxidoreductase